MQHCGSEAGAQPRHGHRQPHLRSRWFTRSLRRRSCYCSGATSRSLKATPLSTQVPARHVSCTQPAISLTSSPAVTCATSRILPCGTSVSHAGFLVTSTEQAELRPLASFCSKRAVAGRWRRGRRDPSGGRAAAARCVPGGAGGGAECALPHRPGPPDAVSHRARRLQMACCGRHNQAACMTT